jgi:membrane protease YdiL (CAAX protease family)
MNTQTVGYKAKAFESRNLVFFFLIAFGLIWFLDALLILGILKFPVGIGENFGTASGILLLVLGSSSTIAAFMMTVITEGKPGVRALWRRFWNRNLSIKWLLVILLILPALRLIANFVSRRMNNQVYPFLDLPNPPWMIILTFITAFIFNGMTEEFGWRGYALPRFQARWNALTSSLILGIIVTSWHIPLFFIPGHPHYQGNFWNWALWSILVNILMTWIFNNTNGSVLAAVLFHTMMNTGIIGMGSVWYYQGVLLLAVILIVIIFGPRNLVRQRLKEGM